MKQLKQILKEKPAYANVYVLSKKGPVKLRELSSIKDIEPVLIDGQAKMLAIPYYTDLAKRNPHDKILSFTLPALEISNADAADHIKNDTEIGKGLVKNYREFLSFVQKRISGELSW